MNLTILTPDKEIFRGQVKSVKVPGSSGQFEVLEGHAAIVSSLQEGQVRIIDLDNKEILYSIEKGFIEVLKNDVAILVQGLSAGNADS